MTQPALKLVTTETFTAQNVHSDATDPAPFLAISQADKDTIKKYADTLNIRGFCKLDDASSPQTRLYNRFTQKICPLTFVKNDFNRWLKAAGLTCSCKSPEYIIYGLTHVVGTVFMPGEGELYLEPKSTCNYVNTYQRYKPTQQGSIVSPLFIEYFDRLVPDENERHIVLQWLAHIFQHPEVRPSWHIWLTSESGTGKGFLVNGILRPLLKHTCVMNKYANLTGKFGTLMLATNLVVLLDDCKLKKGETIAEMKSLLSEEQVRIEPKGLDASMSPVYARVISASNDMRHAFDESERRWFVPARIRHKIDRAETQLFIKSLSDWLKEDGSLDKVYNWFMKYDLTNFNPKYIDQSAALKTMIDAGDPAKEVFESLARKQSVFTTEQLMNAFDQALQPRPNVRLLPQFLSKHRYEKTRPRIEGKQISLIHRTGMSNADIQREYHRANHTYCAG